MTKLVKNKLRMRLICIIIYLKCFFLPLLSIFNILIYYLSIIVIWLYYYFFIVNE